MGNIINNVNNTRYNYCFFTLQWGLSLGVDANKIQKYKQFSLTSCHSCIPSLTWVSCAHAQFSRWFDLCFRSPGPLINSLIFQDVHLRKVRLHTCPGACRLQVRVQASFCCCAFQTRGQTWGQYRCYPAVSGRSDGSPKLSDQRCEPRHRHCC